MSSFYELHPPHNDTEPQLPPLLNCELVSKNQDPIQKALVAANSENVGTLFYNKDNNFLNFAITLGPEVSKFKALQIHYVMMLGCNDALSALAPPEIEISHIWPNLILMNHGLMGQILLYDSGEKIEKIPSWIVLGVNIRMKVLSKLIDNNLEPTSLEDEGGGYISRVRIIESISRHFLAWLNTWEEEGFKPIHKQWVQKIETKVNYNFSKDDSDFVGLDENGLGLFKKNGKHYSVSLNDLDLTQ